MTPPTGNNQGIGGVKYYNAGCVGALGWCRDTPPVAMVNSLFQRQIARGGIACNNMNFSFP